MPLAFRVHFTLNQPSSSSLQAWKAGGEGRELGAVNTVGVEFSLSLRQSCFFLFLWKGSVPWFCKGGLGAG